MTAKLMNTKISTDAEVRRANLYDLAEARRQAGKAVCQPLTPEDHEKKRAERGKAERDAIVQRVRSEKGKHVGLRGSDSEPLKPFYQNLSTALHRVVGFMAQKASKP